VIFCVLALFIYYVALEHKMSSFKQDLPWKPEN